MKQTFGSVDIDTTPPGLEPGPYLFFACNETGLNGELWGLAAETAPATLKAMEPDMAQAVLQATGSHLGGDSSARFNDILSMAPSLERGQLRFPGELQERDGETYFVAASGKELLVNSQTAWRNHNGSVTGVPMGRTKDFSCGGNPDAPAFLGGTMELSSGTPFRTSVVEAGSARSPTPVAAPGRRRARPR